MAKYYYKVKNKTGQLIEGIIEAASTEKAADILLQNNLAIIEINEQANDYRNFLKNFYLFKRVKSKDLVIFFRQMAVMIDANVPLVRGLRILAKQTDNEYLKEIIIEIANEIEGGRSLSSAMSIFSEIFSDFYVNIIMSGETSGRLSEVMNYLADQKERDYELEAKIKGAMIYPAFIVLVLVVVGFIIIAFVIPTLSKVLTESGVKLPLITRLLVSFSQFVAVFWWLIILLFLAVIISWMLFIKTPQGEYLKDSLKINLPVFGKIWKNIYIVRFCRSFNTLIKGGVPISQSLVVVEDVIDNVIYKKIINNTIKSVNEGNPVSEGLDNYKHIPKIMVQMIRVGEDSGKLEEVLEKTADFYSKEIENDTRNLSNLIEPIIMIILGLVVGLFITAVILPMWQLSTSF